MIHQATMRSFYSLLGSTLLGSYRPPTHLLQGWRVPLGVVGAVNQCCCDPNVEAAAHLHHTLMHLCSQLRETFTERLSGTVELPRVVLARPAVHRVCRHLQGDSPPGSTCTSGAPFYQCPVQHSLLSAPSYCPWQQGRVPCCRVTWGVKAALREVLGGAMLAFKPDNISHQLAVQHLLVRLIPTISLAMKHYQA